MTNVCVTSSITVFHDPEPFADDISSIRCREYLQRRESAERTAAKRSPTLAGRRIYQELAQLFYAARKEIKADGRAAK